MSLREQINILSEKEDIIKEEIATLEARIKEAKKEANIILKARVQLEKLEEKFNG